MASNITLSAGVRQNLLSLQNTAALMSTTQSRLATGKKVNTALDNPTNFFTSSALQSRANDLNALLDSMANGIKTLEAADNGLTSITKAVESMQSTLRQARQDKSWQGASYELDATAIGTSAAKYLTISGGAVTGNINVALNTASVTGTAATLSTAGAYTAPVAARQATYTAQNLYAADVPGAGESVDLAIDYTIGGATTTLNVTIGQTETTVAEAVDKINSAILLDANLNGKIKAQDNTGKLEIVTIANEDATLAVGETLNGGAGSLFGTAVTQTGSDGLTEFTVNGDLVSVNVSNGANVDAAVNSINLQLSAANSLFEAFNDSGKLGIREKSPGGNTLTIGGADSALFAALTNTGTAGNDGTVMTVDEIAAAINADVNLAGKVKASNDAGKLRIDNLSTIDLTVVGATSTKVNGGTGGSNTQTIKGNEVRKNLATQFNDLRDQLNKLADDASFNGVNLLKGDKLKITFNENGSSTIEIQAKDTSGNPRNISTDTNSLNIAQVVISDMDSDDNIDAMLDGLATSLSVIRAQASSFGSNLSIVQNRQDFTKAMITTLETGADNLVLADSNEEAANMLALQTRQQLASTALSLASQADQAVLRLFG
ncbi:MAG: flagellin [Xanthobacteraceae bacterium]